MNKCDVLLRKLRLADTSCFECGCTDRLLVRLAGSTLEDGRTSCEHPPPPGGLDSRPWGSLCGEEGDEGRPSLPALQGTR